MGTQWSGFFHRQGILPSHASNQNYSALFSTKFFKKKHAPCQSRIGNVGLQKMNSTRRQPQPHTRATASRPARAQRQTRSALHFSREKVWTSLSGEYTPTSAKCPPNPPKVRKGARAKYFPPCALQGGNQKAWPSSLRRRKGSEAEGTITRAQKLWDVTCT